MATKIKQEVRHVGQRNKINLTQETLKDKKGC